MPVAVAVNLHLGTTDVQPVGGSNNVGEQVHGSWDGRDVVRPSYATH